MNQHLERARKGPEVWNEWAARELRKPKERRAQIMLSRDKLNEVPDFSGFIFPGLTTFVNCSFATECFFQRSVFEDHVQFAASTFRNLASFDSAIFKETADFHTTKFAFETDFEGACFHGTANFGEAQFHSVVRFDRSEFLARAIFSECDFENESDFLGTIFQNQVEFSESKFKRSTDFSSAVFHRAPKFHGASLHLDTRFSSGDEIERQFRDYEGEGSESAYRVLKSHMHNIQSHRDEQFFFRMEMKSRAVREPFVRRFFYRLYEFVSGYGNSIGMPVVWWSLVYMSTICIYGLGSKFTAFDSWLSLTIAERFLNAVMLSLATAFPAGIVSRTAMEQATKALYNVDPPAWIWIVGTFHSIVSLVLVFLFLLGLRNLFRLK